MRRVGVAAGFVTAFMVLAVTNEASAGQCWPGTDERPLKGEIVITTSGGSLADSLRKVFWDRFEKECGVRVASHPMPGRTFSQTQTLIESGNAAFDVLLTLTPEEFPLLKRAGLIQKLPNGFWDGLSDKMMAGSLDPYGAWSAPSSTVLIYSKTAFPEGLDTWADFWNVKKYPGPRILQNSPLNVVIALLSLGVAPKDVYPITDEKLARAFARLNQIRPHVRTYWNAADQPVQGVGRGEFVAGSAWNGRVMVAQKQGLPIGVSWNGNLLSNSSWVIPKGAKNPRAAAAYIRFLNANPQYLAEYAKRMGYGYPRSDVLSLLPPDLASNLPTAPENLEVSARIDAEWWADNITRMGKIWSTWVATGKYSDKQ